MTSVRARRSARFAAFLAAGALLVLAACTDGSPGPAATVGGSPEVQLSPPATPPTTTPPAPPTTATAGDGSGDVRATVSVVASDLPVPWGLATLPDGRLLVTFRDAGEVALLDPATGDRTTLTGPGADDLARTTDHGGEGGLLGVAVSPGFADDHRVFLYRTTDTGNEVVRATLDGTVLGALTTIVDGIPAGSIHNGGRLAFGPDRDLYVTTGDAVGGSQSQDLGSLGGKILRVTQDGDPAPGNPFGASRVWSWGHRNVQGVGWAPDGRMFASEFGQDTWDELNLVVPGGNYGWPVVEGRQADGAGTDPSDPPAGYRDPLVTWRTADASPSGLAVTAHAVYLAGLRGERLWRVPLTPDGVGTPRALLADEHARLRAVVAVSSDAAGTDVLYVLTNDTDGRGAVQPGDDRLLRVTVAPAG